MKKQVTCGSFLKYRYISDPQLSPDGRVIAFVCQQADFEGNKYTGDLYSVENGETRRLTNENSVKSLCWTPQGTILFPAILEASDKARVDNGEELTVYYEIDKNGNGKSRAFELPLKARGLTSIGGDLYYFLANYDTKRPDTLEGVRARKEKEKIYFTVDEVPFWKDSDYVMNGRRVRLYLYNRKENRCIPVSDPAYEVEHVAVRGDEILYSVMAYQNGIRSMDAAVRLYNVKTGEDKEIMPVGKLMLRNYNQTFCEFWGDKILIVGTDQKTYGAMESPKFYLLDRNTGGVSLFCDYPYGINYRSVGNDSKLGKGRGWKIHNGKAYFLSTVGYSTYVRTLDEQGKISEFLTRPAARTASISSATALFTADFSEIN